MLFENWTQLLHFLISEKNSAIQYLNMQAQLKIMILNALITLRWAPQ